MKKIIWFPIFLFNIINSSGQCWQSVTVGYGHTLAIKKDGSLWASGYNNYGQLGDTTTVDKSFFTRIDTNTKWKNITAAGNRSYAIKNDNTLWSWGFNYSRILGHDSEEFKFIAPVEVNNASNWESICPQNSFTDYAAAPLVIKTDGTLWTLTNLPYQVGVDNNWKSAAVGFNHSLAIKKDGTLWAWGNAGLNPYSVAPLQRGTDTGWSLVSAGGEHSLALKKDGTLWAWGYNGLGQLGDGSTTFESKDIPFKIGSDTNWKNIAACSYQSFAVKKNGTLWAWGRNDDGQLGIGTTQNSNIPVQIGGDSDWESIFAGPSSSFALKTDGSLWAWGYNGFGQLGIGTTQNSNIPVQVSCNNTVPITLTAFKVQKDKKAAVLNWQTAWEQNSKKYQIQRSTDGIGFVTIAIVASNNNASGSNYIYTDIAPVKGHNYYRIKAIDADNKYNYSRVVMVIFDSVSVQVDVYPNPVKNFITITSNFSGKKLKISITEITGKKIMQFVKPNSTKIEISGSDLVNGFYILTVSDGENTISRKIIKN